MVGGSARPSRNIHILGTTGEILGVFEDSKFVVRKIDPGPKFPWKKLKEKKFIDTVKGLTIFIGKKNDKGEMFNIFLKDEVELNFSNNSSLGSLLINRWESYNRWWTKEDPDKNKWIIGSFLRNLIKLIN